MNIPNSNILYLNRVDSTNDFLKKLVKNESVKSPFCVYTGYQEQGKGQRNRYWESAPGLNLLCSLLVDTEIELPELSHLSYSAALAVLQTLKILGIPDAEIKWPNDIYIRNKKLAGILIENALSGDKVRSSIVGVGVNINQIYFESGNHTSLSAELGKELQVRDVLDILYQQLYANVIRDQDWVLVQLNEVLYKKHQLVTFEHSKQYKQYEVLQLMKNGNLLVKKNENFLELEHHNTKWIN